MAFQNIILPSSSASDSCIYHSAWCNIPDNLNLKHHRFENVRSSILLSPFVCMHCACGVVLPREGLSIVHVVSFCQGKGFALCMWCRFAKGRALHCACGVVLPREGLCIVHVVSFCQGKGFAFAVRIIA